MLRLKLRKLLGTILVACITTSILMWLFSSSNELPQKSPAYQPPIVKDSKKEPDVPNLNVAANARGMGRKAGAPPLLSESYKPEDNEVELIAQIGGQSRISGVSKKLLPRPKQIPRKEKYPVMNPYRLPLESSTKKLPKIQATEFGECSDREDRLKKVRSVMDQTWQRYKKMGWGHDEIHPISGKPRDPFLGWGATLVDGLDTLWIMDMKEEFDIAVDKVTKFDFTRSGRDVIPLFETTIRYLGGLLSAYDLSGDKRLYYKAIELGDNLIGAFDTPNRMPLLHYRWDDTSTETRRRATQGATAAEVGSMTIEFTRLAQLTGNHSYFDVVHRITKEFEKAADEQAVPGLFPALIDISGCDLNQKGEDTDPLVQIPVSFVSPQRCKPKGITPMTAFIGTEQTITFGGRIDSLYEYYLKEYILLGGADDTYKKLYIQSADQGAKMLLYKPNTTSPDELLFSGDLYVSAKDTAKIMFSPTMTHLTCFLGGMYAMGGKIMGRPKDVEIGQRLTQGCVWAYEATGTGVMPEELTVSPCGDSVPGKDDACQFVPPKLEVQRYVLSEKGTIVDTQDEEDEFEEIIEVSEVKQTSKSKYSLYELGVSPVSRREEYPKLYLEPPFRHVPLTKLKDEEIKALPEKLKDRKYRWRQSGVYDLPREMTTASPTYLMRPEAIESVYYMYRITGDPVWQDRGWKMFQSVIKLCHAGNGAFAAIRDVTDWRMGSGRFMDEQESFWVGETLKYYYLLFADPEVISLDNWVFNTEAHPVKRQ